MVCVMSIEVSPAGLVIGIPHSGVVVPLELRAALLDHVDEPFLRSQSDGWTDRIYAVPGARCIVYPWSRVVADPNRAEDQYTEGGVLPVTDFAENDLYRPGRRPGLHEHHVRVIKYHRPYHEQVADAIADPRTSFYIDAHSMMETAPVRSPDHGLRRPDAVLGNRPSSKLVEFGLGDELSCPAGLSDYALARLRHHLLTIPAPPGPEGSNPDGTVRLNDPFPGGYGVSNHTNVAAGIPGLQVELNQRLWIVEDGYSLIPGRIDWMAGVVTAWVTDVLAALAQEPSKISASRATTQSML
jgi:N-formylglutamate amidohydrolase